jgi:PEGA domain
VSARRIWWSARASRYAKAVSRSETTAVLVDDGYITSAVASLSGQKRKGQHRAAHGYSLGTDGATILPAGSKFLPGSATTALCNVRNKRDLAIPCMANFLHTPESPAQGNVIVIEGGTFHSILVSPGRHRVKVELPGYRTFETEINPLAGQRTEIRTELVKGRSSSHSRPRGARKGFRSTRRRLLF